MPNFVYSYRVPSDYVPHAGTATEWQAWFGGMGSALEDALATQVVDYAPRSARSAAAPEWSATRCCPPRTWTACRWRWPKDCPALRVRRWGRGRPRDGSRRVVSVAIDRFRRRRWRGRSWRLGARQGHPGAAVLGDVPGRRGRRAIVNVALPTIRAHLGFSVQNLQWVVSGYLITYGGFLLLGGRAGDLLGRRRLLVAGTVLFAASSLACGLADSQGLLVGARLAQGIRGGDDDPGRAVRILTTTFQVTPTGTRRWACGPGSAGWPPQSGCSSAGCSPRTSAGDGCSS